MTCGRAQAHWAYVRFLVLYTTALRVSGTQMWLVVSCYRRAYFWRPDLHTFGMRLRSVIVQSVALHLCRSFSTAYHSRISFSLAWAFAAFISDLSSFHYSRFAFHHLYEMQFNHFIYDTQLRSLFEVHSLTNLRWLKLLQKPR